MLFLNRILEPKDNAPEIAVLMTDLLGVKISVSTLTKEIEEHPESTTLLSISDVYSRYGIENIGIRMNPDTFLEMPVPFITQLRRTKESGNYFSIVREIQTGAVSYFNAERQRWEVMSQDDFLKQCTGVALLVEAEDGAGEKDYEINTRKEQKKNIFLYMILFSIPIISMIAGCSALVKYGLDALFPFLFMLTLLAGFFVGGALVWYEIDQHNPVLQQICNGGKKINCGAVLQSKASRIGGISWGVIGFSYFTGLLVLMLFSGINSTTMLSSVAWINAMAAPYILFSVYYQWRVAKQWCMLCLSAQGLLALELLIGLLGHWHTLLPVREVLQVMIIPVLSAFILPFVSTVVLVPALKRAKESKRLNTELQKLKHNKQMFSALLQKQKQVKESVDGLGIILGNPDAPYKLIKVCNPYCGPCAKAHTPIEELLHNNPDIQVQVIFTATTREGDGNAPPVKHMLAIAEKAEESVLRQALDNWYLPPNKNYEAFAAKYPMNGELMQQDAKLDAMADWCNKTDIQFTPTFFVKLPENNGEEAPGYYQLPDVYSVADLKYFFSV